MRLASSLFAVLQSPFAAPPSPAAGGAAASPSPATQPSGAGGERLGRFQRDFHRYPLLAPLQAPGAPPPAQVMVLPDVHAAAQRLFPLLANNSVVRLRDGGPAPSEHCGGQDDADWGAFRWDNPYEWSFGDGVLLSLGDRINKGPFNLVTECFFRDLAAQANRAGGRVVTLWGNHETQAGADWDSVKTRGPGGILFELWAYGIDPERFFAADGVYGGPLQRQPVMASLGDDRLFVHGGVCPSKDTLPQVLDRLARGLEDKGFATDELLNQNSLTRCRLQQGHRGTLTPGDATELVYAHDPEHDPRGEPTCSSVSPSHGKPFVYCRTDVGLTPYINYSLGALVRYRTDGNATVRESCNELGACRPLDAVATSPSADMPWSMPRRLRRGARPAAGAGARPWAQARPAGAGSGAGDVSRKNRGLPRPALDPGRSPHRGLTRNYTTHPAVAVVPKLRGDLFVVGEVLGALLPLRRLLEVNGLIARDELLAPPRWTGGNSVLVTCGNLFGLGYFNLEAMRLFHDLEPQAKAAGGGVFALLGKKEVDFLRDPNNDDTWAGGGLATQLVGQNSWPEDFARREPLLHAWLRNRPFGLRVHDLLATSGSPLNKPWRQWAADIEENLDNDNFGADFISGPNSFTNKIDFAGRDGRKGPIFAKDMGVSTVLHGLNTQQEPVDDIKLYGRKDGVTSLINVATRLNPALGGGQGALLRVRLRGETLQFDAIDLGGNRKRLERRRRDRDRTV